MRAEDKQSVASLVAHRGYRLMLEHFKKNLQDLEQRMRMESNSEEEDRRLLIQWKSLKSFMEDMTEIPSRNERDLIEESERMENASIPDGLSYNVMSE